MSTRLWSLLFAVILAGSNSVFSREVPAEKRTDLATVQGRAVNSVTGQPFTSEILTLRALPPSTDVRVIQPDAEGRFSFDEIEPGSYILCVKRFGDDGMPLKLSARQVLKDVEFKINPPGAIRGVVLDDEGKPLPRVMVTTSGGSAKSSMGIATTNDAGEFRFPNLVPGSYVLLATPMGGRVVPAAPASAGEPDKAEERLLPTYYPAAGDAAWAAPLEVVPGQELQGITIIVRKGPVYHVKGTVLTSSPDTPLAEIRLSMSSLGPGGVTVAGALKRDGSFDFGGVRPGSYYLSGWRQPPLDTVILGRVQVDVNDADVAGVVLRIGEPRQILGTMRMEGDDESDFLGVRLEFRPLDSRTVNFTGGVVDAENTFSLKNVPPERLLLVVTGLPEKAYTKSLRLGGWETIDSVLDLTDMQTVPPLDILISPNGATVEGTVNQDGGKSSPGAWVCLAPDPARPELVPRIKFATTTGDGKFSFAGIPPGEYRIFAFEPLKRSPYGNLECLKPFESKAMKLSLKEGERKQADVRAVKLEGR